MTSTAKAIKAIKFVLENEGGFVNNPSDPGGATNFGISLRFLRQLSEETLRKCGIFTPAKDLTPMNVSHLMEEQAGAIYQCEFWDKAPFDRIMSDAVAAYIFDGCVNFGMFEGIKLAQRALFSLDFRHTIIEDGILGQLTIGAINTIGETLFHPLLMATRAEFYRFLVFKNPKDKDFLNGWLNRAYRWPNL